MQQSGLINLLFIPLFTCFFLNCAAAPPCISQVMPLVEIQIGNTASNHDDYATTTSFIPCRVRIVNYLENGGSELNFSGGVEVEVRNVKLATDLVISETNSGTSSAFFTTLPSDGKWKE